MKKFLLFLKTRAVAIFTFCFFTIAIALIMILMPTEKMFEYEYQENKRWMHDDLRAPFTFAIDKSQDEIAEQRNRIMSNFSPYYVFDDSVYKQVTNAIYQGYIHKFSSVNADSVPNYVALVAHEHLHDFAEELARCYNRGVIDELKPYKSLIVERSTGAPLKCSVDSVLKLPELHVNLLNKIPTSFDSTRRNTFKEIIFQSMQPNTLYNQEKSIKLEANFLSNVSEKKDFVKEGSLIISEGDIITAKHCEILDSLKKEYAEGNISFRAKINIIIGQFLLISVAFFVLFLLVQYSDSEAFKNVKYSLFILTLVILFVALASLSLKFNHIQIYLIPFVGLPLLIKNFMNNRVALFVHIVTMLLISFMAPNPFEFLFLQVSVGVIAVYCLGNHYQRSFLVTTSLVSLLAYAVIYVGFSLTRLGSLYLIDWLQLLWFLGSSFLLLSTYLFIYIFEKIFQMPSDLTLFELSDTNRGVLRELAEKAPGTFQHSLQVANYVEVALREIGGNVLLGRIGGLYHDIGKLRNPAYFVENSTFRENPHDNLAPEQSAKIIIDHVNYGRELARKYKLPYALEQIIYGHHGNSKTIFFLDKYRKLHPDEDFDESIFQYPTSKVVKKELAVIMIADGIEAASRNAHFDSHEQADALVQKIIENLIQSKQLEYADITLRELDLVRGVFTEKLISSHHVRVPYPDLADQNLATHE